MMTELLFGGGGTPTFTYTFVSNKTAANFKTSLQTTGWDGVSAANLQVVNNSGVVLLGADTGAIPMSCSLKVTNKGRIQGPGGAGGRGGNVNTSIPRAYAAAPGSRGGTALNISTGCTVTLDNGAGYIWGGGGGAGGGAPAFYRRAGTYAAAGSGGGAGYGGGTGGAGGTVSGGSGGGVNGNPGGAGSASSRGAGGTPVTEGGALYFAYGGQGGTGGLPGGAGGSGYASRQTGNPTYGYSGAGAAGGAAGYAVKLNGHGGTVAFISGAGAPNVKGPVA